MKRGLSGSLGILLALVAFWITGIEASGEKPVVLCGVFPAFLLAREILPSEEFTLETLIPDNVGCSHQYTLTPGDMARIGASQVYISEGKKLEFFLDRIRQEFPNLQVVDCSVGVHLPPEFGKSQENSHYFSCLAGLEAMGEVLFQRMMELFPQKKEVLRKRFEKLKGTLGEKKRAFQELGISGKKIPVAIIHNSLEYALREVGFQIVEEIDSDGDHNTVLSPRELLGKIHSFQEKGVRAIFYDTPFPPPVAQTLSEESRVPLIRWTSLAMRDPDIPLEKALDSAFDANLAMLKKLFSDEGD